MGNHESRGAALLAAPLAALALAWAMPAALAAGPTLALDASARAQVANDEMQVTLAAERDGAQVAELNDAVLAQLNAAIAEAKAAGGVRARLGSLWTQPMTDRDGRPRGWRVRGEVVLDSGEMRALGALASRLSERLQLAGVQFRLSEARRRQEETRLLGDAAAAFRQRADDAAKAFGYAGYEIRELALDGAQPPAPRVRAYAAADARARVAAAAPVPAEGGESDVVVSVSGTVELR